MPFDANGIWTLPEAKDHADFHTQLLSKRQEIAPTQEMIQAIAANAAPAASSVRQDPFGAIGKLQGAVDIVIPVYGGLHVLVPCIDSIEAHTKWPFRLIIVDDASPDPEIGKYLTELGLSERFTDLAVVTNQRNRGFAPSVNRGVAIGDNPYVCVLNSDTIVTDGWLVRQLVALEADERNVLVNPATNNTALVNVSMYPGCSYRDMAHAVAVAANTSTYNEVMPTGFCFTMGRKLWEEVGPFDEAYVSYGEETDFWFKAIKQTSEDGTILNNRAVIADNAYVFHERGTSFSQLSAEEHMGLRRSGSERFNALHPDYREWAKGHDAGESVRHLREDLPREAFKREYKGNIAWVVKSAGPCGGMLFITDIVNQLIEEGYNAKVCVVAEQWVEGSQMPVCGNLRTAPILFKSYEEFTSTFAQRVFTSGKVFAGVTEMTPLVWQIDQRLKGIEGFNHVQSYDPELAISVGKAEAIPAIKESYRALSNIASSQWVADKLIEEGCDVQGVILPGVNPRLFHPRDRASGDERFTVAIVMNEEYEFKGKTWAREFIKALAPEKQPNLRVLAIGPKSIDLRGVTCIGSLSQAKMADLLGTEVDILVDPAQVHSYGLPVLEALFSGCHAICRENKGVHEYEKSMDNRVLVTEDVAEAVEYCEAMSYETAATYEPIYSRATDRFSNVKKFIDFVYPDITVKGHRIEVITPHMRKHGGPTTIATTAQQLKALGHDTSMSMIYTDWSPEVMKSAAGLRIRTDYLNLLDDVEIEIINSDNPFAAQIMAANRDKKYIMLKLSHNPRFKQVENDNLNLPWDHIMTSTQWLADACTLGADETWTHKRWDPAKVTVIGWYHYAHEIFNMPPSNRTYGTATAGFSVGTLVHPHPLKGSNDAVASIDGLKRKYKDKVHAVGFGELRAGVPQYMQYLMNQNRADMAHSFKQIDFWLGASHSEGLGRMSLEAMSAGCVVVTTDTGAEFLKDGENCLLYPVGNPQAGAEAIDRLANDRELFTKVLTNGYETAKAAADPSVYRRNLSKVIKAVAENG